ncbi:asparagine synthase (glutamine-hydrolyzing) [Bacteroidota bacterium]
MCGIAGIVGQGSEGLIKDMCDTMAHRGPDDWGYYIKDNVFLGHRRLSVIDLSSKGRQPLQNEDGSVQLVCNGEVYNFRELREELLQQGHKFYSGSDSEVILHAYEDDGEECLQRLKGAFAFALWDANQGKLFLARDRIGEKPLYYFYDGTTLYFASEIKAILRCGVPRKVNVDSLNLYMSLGYVPSPYTMFDGISKLPPAHYALFQDGQLNFRQYWDITDFQDMRGSERSISEEVRERLQRAVQSQTISDRPLGIFLSGGLDSSSVLSVYRQFDSSPVKTFSLGFKAEFEQEKFNEDFKLARGTSRFLGTDHNEFYLTSNDVVNSFEKIVYHLDEPISNPAHPAQFQLAKMAKQQVDVVLGGDGGDETFGGFSYYWQSQLMSLFQFIPPVVRRGVITPMVNTLLPRYRDKNRMANTPGTAERYLLFVSEDKDKVRRIVDNEHYRGDVPLEFIQSTYFSKTEIPLTKRLMYTDLKTRLPDSFMLGSDKVTMAFPVEQRSPFLDHELVEFAFKIPVRLKVRRKETKYILWKAMSGRVPAQVLRGKRYFFPPVAKWMRAGLRPLMEDYLSIPSLEKSGVFDSASVRKMLQDHLEYKEYNMGLLWAIFTFQIWHKQFIERQV